MPGIVALVTFAVWAYLQPPKTVYTEEEIRVIQVEVGDRNVMCVKIGHGMSCNWNADEIIDALVIDP